MSSTRRDFIKSFGISIASLVLTRCASDQNDYVVGIEPSVANLPHERTRGGVGTSTKPNVNPSQEPSPMTTKKKTVESPPSQVRGHPMTPKEGLKYYPFNDPAHPAYIRLRKCWENLYLLEMHLYDPSWTGGNPRPMLIDSHLAALDELVIMGELSQEGAGELHEAFLAAINYVVANTIPMVCYD